MATRSMFLVLALAAMGVITGCGAHATSPVSHPNPTLAAAVPAEPLLSWTPPGEVEMSFGPSRNNRVVQPRATSLKPQLVTIQGKPTAATKTAPKGVAGYKKLPASKGPAKAKASTVKH